MSRAGIAAALVLSFAVHAAVCRAQANVAVEPPPDPTVAETQQTDNGPRKLAPIATAREMFDELGVDESLFYIFINGGPLAEAEAEPIAKVLLRLPNVKAIDVERWAKRDVSWADVASRPRDFQREFVRLDGRLRRVTIEKPLPEIQERYELDQYYRCEMLLGGNQPAVVFARTVPSKWKLDTAIDERASCFGVFLKVGPKSDDEAPVLSFAADRIAWHPPTPLGSAGMDYGLFDTVEQQRPITHEDRECFLQMLAAAGRDSDAKRPPDALGGTPALRELLASPSAHVGQRYSFRGVARRAVKIRITDADTIARFGFDHYFELVVFLDLGGELKLGDRKVRSYPIVFCLRSLPAGMPTGEDISEMVQASGYMFKKWPYTTQLTQEKSPDLRIFSPLLVGNGVHWEQAQSAPPLIGPVVGTILFVVVAGIALFVWLLGRRDRKIHAEVVSKNFELPPGQSLNDLALDIPARDEDDKPST